MIGRNRKAVAAFPSALAIGLGTASVDGKVEGWELIIAIVGSLGVALGVWATPANDPPKSPAHVS